MAKFEGKDEQPFLHLMEFEDYLGFRRKGEDDDEVSHHSNIFIGHLGTFLNLKGKMNNHFYTYELGLWSLKTI